MRMKKKSVRLRKLRKLDFKKWKIKKCVDYLYNWQKM